MKHMNLTLKKTLVPLALVASLAATQVAGLNLGLGKVLNDGYSIAATADAASVQDFGTIVAGTATTLNVSNAQNKKLVFYTAGANTDDATPVYTSGEKVAIDESDETKGTVSVTLNAGEYDVYYYNATDTKIGTISAKAACAAADLEVPTAKLTIQPHTGDAGFNIEVWYKSGKKGTVAAPVASSFTVAKKGTTTAEAGASVSIIETGALVKFTELPADDVEYDIYYDGTDAANKIATVKILKPIAGSSSSTTDPIAITADNAVKAIVVDEKSSLTWAPSIDVLASSAEKVENNVSLKLNNTAKVSYNDPAAASFTLSSKKNADQDVAGIAIKTTTTGEGNDAVTTNNMSAVVDGKFTLTLEAEATAAAQTLYVNYLGKTVAQVKYAPVAALADGKTAISEAGVISYAGDSTTITIKPSYKIGKDTKKVTAVGSIGNKVTVVNVATGVTAIGTAGNTSALSSIAAPTTDDLDQGRTTWYLPDTITYVGPNVFKYADKVVCSDRVAKLITGDSFVDKNAQETGIPIIDSKSAIESSKSFVVPGGTVIDLKNGTNIKKVVGETETNLSSEATSSYLRQVRDTTGFTVDTSKAGWIPLAANTEKTAKANAVVDGTVKTKFTLKNTSKKNVAIDFAYVADTTVKKDYDILQVVRMYVQPAASTDWKTPTLKPSKNGKFAATTGTANSYDLELQEGETVKLPFALADGSDKTVLYSSSVTSGSFTVVKGAVKGLEAGTGTITVKAADPTATAADITVNVTVTAKAATKVVADTSALTLEKWTSSASENGVNKAQAFTISGDSLNRTAFNANVKIDADADCYEYSTTKPAAKGTIWSNFSTEGADLAVTGSQTIWVRMKSGADPTKKSAKLTFTVGSNKGSTNVNIKYVDSGKKMYAMISGFKATSAKKSIDIPVGTNFKMNMAVTPATADNRFTWNYVTDANGNAFSTANLTAAQLTEYNALTATDNKTVDEVKADWLATKAATWKNNQVSGLSVNGNILTASRAGTYYIQAQTLVSFGFDASSLTPCAKSDVYTVNVYEPSSGIAYPKALGYEADGNKAYTVQAGSLITQDEANSTSDATFKAGQTFYIPVPEVLGGAEDVVWESNNNIGLVVSKTTHDFDGDVVKGGNGEDKNDQKYKAVDALMIHPNIPGNYTITGTSKYTKQSIKLKVTVGTPTVDEFEAVQNPAAVSYEVDESGSLIQNGGAAAQPIVIDVTNLKKATKKFTVLIDSDACGKITFASADSKLLKVDAKGTLTASAITEAEKAVTVTATVTHPKDKTKTYESTLYVKIVNSKGTSSSSSASTTAPTNNSSTTTSSTVSSDAG